MTMVGITGWEHSGYKTCLKSVQFAIDTANKNKAILPNFNLKLEIYDEGLNSEKAVTGLASYWRQFHLQLGAPIALGPTSSTGCKPFGKLLKPMHMFAIGKGCTSPQFSIDKRTYFGLIRVRFPGENMAISQIRFIKEMGWSHIAMVATMRDLDYDLSNIVHIGALAANITVDWFEVLEGESLTTQVGINLLKSLKHRDSRVIVAIFARWNELADFLCTAYETGIKGAKYVFIAMAMAYQDVDDWTDSDNSCSIEQIKEQLAITFFIGDPPPSELKKYEGMSSLGVTNKDLDAEIANLKGELDFDMSSSCFDNAMTAIIALNKTNEKLEDRFQSNLTLWYSNPELVLRMVAESFRRLSLEGLYHGKFELSRRMAMDSKPMFTFQTISRTSTKLVWQSEMNAGEEVLDPNGYSFKELQPVVWKFGNQPPRDQAKVLKFIRDVDPIFRIVVIVLAILLLIVQIGWICFAIFKRKRQQQINNRILGYVIGCILLNFTAITFALATVGNNEITVNVVLCNLRAILLSTSIIILHAITIVKLRYLVSDSRQLQQQQMVTFIGSRWPRPNFARTNMQQNRNKKKRPVPNGKTIEKIRNSLIEKARKYQNKRQFQFVMAIIGLNSIFLLIWLTANPMFFKLEQAVPYLDESIDTLIFQSESFCNSPNFNIWIGIQLATHGIMMICCLFFFLNLRTAAWQSLNLNDDLKTTRIVELFHSSLFIISIVLVYIYDDSKIRREIISIVSIIDSFFTFVIIIAKKY